MIDSEETGRRVKLWQECPRTSALTCSMDPDHPPMQWDDRGFLICIHDASGEECGFIRYDINPQILLVVHRHNHHGCHMEGMEL